MYPFLTIILIVDMAKFRYRFENVLKQKKREEENIRRKMAPFLENLNNIENQRRRFSENLATLNKNKTQWMSSSVEIEHFVQLSGYYREIINQSTINHEAQNEKLSPLREELRRAIYRRKAFEIILEKDLLAHKRQQLKKEQKELDEISARRHKKIRQR